MDPDGFEPRRGDSGCFTWLVGVGAFVTAVALVVTYTPLLGLVIGVACIVAGLWMLAHELRQKDDHENS